METQDAESVVDSGRGRVARKATDFQQWSGRGPKTRHVGGVRVARESSEGHKPSRRGTGPGGHRLLAESPRPHFAPPAMS